MKWRRGALAVMVRIRSEGEAGQCMLMPGMEPGTPGYILGESGMLRNILRECGALGSILRTLDRLQPTFRWTSTSCGNFQGNWGIGGHFRVWTGWGVPDTLGCISGESCRARNILRDLTRLGSPF